MHAEPKTGEVTVDAGQNGGYYRWHMFSPLMTMRR